MNTEERIADLKRQIAELKAALNKPQYFDFSGCGGVGEFKSHPNDMFGLSGQHPFSFVCKSTLPPNVPRGHAICLNDEYEWSVVVDDGNQFLVGTKCLAPSE